MENNNDNSFRNVIDISQKEKRNHNVKNHVVIPFLSGVLGCGLVIGTCFGVPEIKQKLVGSQSSQTSTSITSSNSSSEKLTGTVDYVSLSSYSNTSVYAANKILPSIVGIEISYDVTTNSIYSFFGRSEQSTSTAKAYGSGIIISEDGYILTNNHVIDSSSDNNTFYSISEAKEIKVKLTTDDKEYKAKIVGRDEQTDLAVIKIDAENLTAAELGDSDATKIGEFAMVVGNPLSLGTTITCGVVSAVNREVTDSTEKSKKYKCIQTDAAINSGASGGALVNSEGKVIGINTLKIVGTGVENVGFAITINSAKSVVQDLIDYGKVKRPFIGINGRSITEDLASRYNLEIGVYITSVGEFSAAEKAGLKIGDVITAVDGKEVKTMDEITEIKNTHSIGDTITISIYRDGEKKDVQVTLGEND